jgi:2',3'-cyclic-nucleotide 2'-phosphodiesterase/3'-nucleotidase
MTMILERLLGEPDTIQLNILSVNDLHGSLLESGNNPGAAKLAAYLKKEKAQNPEGTLILSAGDMMQGSADSNLLNGEPVIEVMNQIGFDAMTIGNHEFDWGVETLQARAEQASFPFLTANVSDKKTGKAITFTKPYIMTERAGVKIGIIGVTTPETANIVLPSIISAYEITDPTAIVNSLASELRRKGAKIIIVVGHLGAYASQNNGELQGEAVTLAKALKGVDVLVTGHTHQTYAENINGVAVVQAAYNGRAVGKVQLSYSPKKVSISQLKVIDIKSLNLSEDASIKAIIDADNEKIGPIKNRIIGKNNQDLTHDSYELSPLGQWFTDSIRQVANVDVVFINGGALRTNIPEGDITVGKLWEVLPFDNTLCTMSMTGTQIKQVLQHGIKNQQYGMVQFSGLRIQYNGSLEPDKRIRKVTLADGTPLQTDKTYRVAVNDFMAEGGDGFTMFKQCPDLINTQEPIRNMLIDNIEKVQSIHFVADDRLQEQAP